MRFRKTSSRVTSSGGPIRDFSSVGEPSAMTPAVIDDAEAVAEPVGFLHVVGCIQDRLALGAQAEDGLEDVVPGLGVYSDGGLVEEEERRPAHEGDGEIDSALHAAGELVDPVLGPIAESNELEIDARLLVGFAAAEAGHLAEKHEVVRCGELRIEGQVLGTYADDLADLVAFALDGVAADEYLAGVGGHDGGEHSDGGRLAGAVGAEESVDLLAPDGEGDAVDGLDVVEALAEVICYEEVFCQGLVLIASVAGGYETPEGLY